jgi:hypothetical protein
VKRAGGGRLTRALLVAALAASVLPLAACSVPLPSSVACGDAPPAILSALQARLVVAGTLRNGRTVDTSPTPSSLSPRIVSAELHRRGDKVHDKGDILSWAEIAPGRFVAVDYNARHDSTWPAARFDVRRPGVITSRGCVESIRGTIPCNSNGNGLMGGGALSSVNSKCKGGQQ